MKLKYPPVNAIPASGVSVSVFEVGIDIRYFSIVYNFWSNKATAGPPGIPVLKTQNPPAKEKIPVR